MARGRPKGSKNKSKANVEDLNGKAERIANKFIACEHGVQNAKALTIKILEKIRENKIRLEKKDEKIQSICEL